MSDSQPETQPNILTSRKVTPLAMSSGGKNSIHTQFHEMNTKRAMLQSQATENKRFDPRPPPPLTKPTILRDGVVVDGFCSDYPFSLAVIGTLLFVYGFVAK